MSAVGWRRHTGGVAAALVLVACSSSPPPTPPPTREQVHPVALEPGGLAWLEAAPEVVAAHHECAPVFGASSCDMRALDYAGVTFGLIGAVAALGVGAACSGPDDGLYIDVASIVRDRFVQSLSTAPFTPKIDSPAACLAGDSVSALRQSYGEEPMIDFTTVDWQRATAGGHNAFIPSTVRGRLVDVKNGQVLWEESCTITPDREPENLDAVRGTLERPAELCGEQFAAQFTNTLRTG